MINYNKRRVDDFDPSGKCFIGSAVFRGLDGHEKQIAQNTVKLHKRNFSQKNKRLKYFYKTFYRREGNFVNIDNKVPTFF